jgi:hypothetical protein
MNDQDLTSGLQDFFANEDKTGHGGGVIGGLGAKILHLVVFAFAIYSGYHGISATARYHASGGLGMMAGIIGILVIEAVLIGLYLAYFSGRITGDQQKFAAAATALLGFTLSCLGIIGDSQMQAGMAVSPWLSTYLTWGLPIAPALMALGAAVVVGTEPKHLRLMAEAVQHEEFEETKHTKRLAKKTAELTVAQDLANIQLNTRAQAARYILAAYRSPEVQDHIQRAAMANLPELLRSVGVDLPYASVIEGQAIDLPPLAAADPEAAAPPAEHPRSWIDALRDRLSGAVPDTNPIGNSTHDAARHDAATDVGATGQGERAPAYQPFAGMTPDELRRLAAELEMARPSANGQEGAGRP